jgi:hypothetical protein
MKTEAKNQQENREFFEKVNSINLRCSLLISSSFVLDMQNYNISMENESIKGETLSSCKITLVTSAPQAYDDVA